MGNNSCRALLKVPRLESPEVVSASAEYMHTKLGISKEEIPHKCYEYYSNFGTTMAGLAVRAPVGFSAALRDGS